MGDNFDILLKKAEKERRKKNGEPEPPEEEPTENREEEPAAEDSVSQEPRHKKTKEGHGWLRSLLVFVLVLALCGSITYVTIICIFDFMGINKSDTKIDAEIPAGAPTTQIAEILQKNHLIDQPLFFRLYSMLSHKDGAYQAGTYSLSADMGYQQIAAILIAGNPRETVRVTIPEGYTIDQIARELEKHNVCTTTDFYDALLHETYDYDFFDTIPSSEDGGVYEGRLYRLEGYLFPDTYEFYTESSGKSVINKFLANFDAKMTTSMRSAISARGLTLDDVVNMASIAQKEAANDKEMPKVTRVLYNRLASQYTRLECDSTALYVADLMPNIKGLEIISTAYNTYQRSGLPAGAICNPGLEALKAAIYPSEDAEIAQCYYFANDKAGNTYYSKTFAQHEAICRRYRIGAYG